MRPSPDCNTARLRRRLLELTSSDPQLLAARPDPAITEVLRATELSLAESIRTVMEGYADRPALGERRKEYVTDPVTGHTSVRLLPQFTTLTYREVWARVRAVARALADDLVQPGDRVAILGFTSVDYTVIDLALALIGAVSVPLHARAPVAQLQPILAETKPALLLSSIDSFDDAVTTVLATPTVARLVVFDYDWRDDGQHALFDVARLRLVEAGNDVVVETLDDVLRRGASHRDGVDVGQKDPEAPKLLIYTSGSTGTPKGAIYTDHLAAGYWRGWFRPDWDEDGRLPVVTLNFMPMSHSTGRLVLHSTLGSGGTAYFTSRSDLSTLLEELAIVRPTKLDLVPRVWEMVFQEVQSEVDRRCSSGGNRVEVEAAVNAELRQSIIGGRHCYALTGSAPISSQLKAWVEDFLGIPLIERYGCTEAGGVLNEGVVRRPPVVDYKLVDVPELGYFGTDRPYPRGELLVKTTERIPGYYQRPEITGQVFDADGWYHTGDVFAELAPDRLQYLDRRSNVVKLSQGEFVTVASLEAAYSGHPLIRQIFIYGNSTRSYLVAVIVPTDAALSCVGGDVVAVKTLLTEALHSSARKDGLQSFEIPRGILVETTPFSVENGLLTGIGKLARPMAKQYYGPRLEQLYVELESAAAREMRILRQIGADRPALETVGRAARALLNSTAGDLGPEVRFSDLGGDSLSALTFVDLLREIFNIDLPVAMVVSPATDIAAIANYIEAQRSGKPARPQYAAVHGREPNEVCARDLTLDRFIGAGTLAAAPRLPYPSSQIRTVLLTGATGFLGRYLALEWLDRMRLADGKVICLVRAPSDSEARLRLDATFDSGDPKLKSYYCQLAAHHLEVIAGDKVEDNLGLEVRTWQRLAETVDLIIDSAALVNHLLPYREMFGPNVVGTAELIRIALTSRQKPIIYVSTIGVGAGISPSLFTESGDIRVTSPTRLLNANYANGYCNSKWASEVLLREAHDLCGLPTAVFRCGMVLSDTTYVGQLNLPDSFTRLMLSLVATGIAPESFYELDCPGKRPRAHYDGLPVEFVAKAISRLGASVTDGFETFHVINPHDDGIGLDEYVDWLIKAGYPIQRIAGYADWLRRFSSALRRLPEKQRRASLLPLLQSYESPAKPIRGSMAPADRFRTSIQDAKIGPDEDIPHITPAIIAKYVADLRVLGLL